VFRTTALCTSHESKPFQTTGFWAYYSPIACSDFFSRHPLQGDSPTSMLSFEITRPAVSASVVFALSQWRSLFWRFRRTYQEHDFPGAWAWMVLLTELGVSA